MIKEYREISLGTAALISGLTLFVPTAPYAEFYVFGKLIVYNDGVIYDILGDAGGANDPQWSFAGTVATGRWRAPITPAI